MLTPKVLAELERLHREFAAPAPPGIEGTMAWKLEHGLRSNKLMWSLLEHSAALLSAARLAEVYEREVEAWRDGLARGAMRVAAFARQPIDTVENIAWGKINQARAATDAAMGPLISGM